MSQLPPLPPGVGPGDFAPMGMPRPNQPAYPQPASRTNGWAVVSLSAGLLGCVPYATGFIAVVAGIIGLTKARDPRYPTGRGMAVGGLVLGALSLLFWLFLSSTFVGLFNAAGQQGKLAQEFVQMIAAGAIDPALERATPTFGRGRIEQLSTQMAEWGTLVDVTSHNNSIDVTGGITTCDVAGTASFPNGEHPFTMTLIKTGDAWQVSAVEFE